MYGNRAVTSKSQRHSVRKKEKNNEEPVHNLEERKKIVDVLFLRTVMQFDGFCRVMRVSRKNAYVRLKFGKKRIHRYNF